MRLQELERLTDVTGTELIVTQPYGGFMYLCNFDQFSAQMPLLVVSGTGKVDKTLNSC